MRNCIGRSWSATDGDVRTVEAQTISKFIIFDHEASSFVDYGHCGKSSHDGPISLDGARR
jgi:hypothetical protein